MAALTQLKQLNNVPLSHPAVLVVDGAPSHNADLMVAVPPSKYLWQLVATPWLFIYFTIPCRSHTLQSGDRSVNLSLRNHTRREAKLRQLLHMVQVAQGSADEQKNGEVVMKQLLLTWVSSWIRDQRTPGWIVSSWKASLTAEPECQSVDDVPGCPAVIYLGPPIAPAASIARLEAQTRAWFSCEASPVPVAGQCVLY